MRQDRDCESPGRRPGRRADPPPVLRGFGRECVLVRVELSEAAPRHSPPGEKRGTGGTGGGDLWRAIPPAAPVAPRARRRRGEPPGLADRRGRSCGRGGRRGPPRGGVGCPGG